MMDSLDSSQVCGDVETAGGADRDPPHVGTGFGAGRDDGPHIIASDANVCV